jgi:hypothetical protein
MPKIRDLGINVIPETMRPPQMGLGGGKGGGCEGASVECPEISACPSGTFQATAGCKDYAECPSGTFQATAGCKDYAECPSGTFQATATCKDYGKDYCPPGTFNTTGNCFDCNADSWATPHLVRLAAAQTGKPEAAGLTREAIEILKQQLNQQIAKLEEIAKNLTSDEK